MEIKILGTGCARCNTLERLTREAVREMGIAAGISKEEDIVNIMNYGVLRTPALVINGKLVLSGRVPPLKEITDIIKNNL